MARVLTVEEAAAYLKVHPETIRRLARSGRVPAMKVGRGWRFQETALVHWAETHHVRSDRFHVLAIDDEPAVLKLLDKILTRNGYRVSTAITGELGLETIIRDPPDVILLDLKMPGMTGPAVLREIRNFHGAVPVIILTGYPDSSLMMEAMAYSPFQVLPKPSEIKQVVQAVEMALAGARAVRVSSGEA